MCSKASVVLWVQRKRGDLSAMKRVEAVEINYMNTSNDKMCTRHKLFVHIL
jgi:hypothetical protein